jgi:LPS export ABC transporter protein LptC
LRTEADASQVRLQRAKANADRAALASKVLMVLGTVGALAAVAYVFWPTDKQVAAPRAPETPTQVSSRQAQISGVDSKDLPYTINAEKSIQDEKARNIVHLETVGGVFLRAGGKTYNVTSQKALYDRDTKQLTLEGSVKISNLPRMEAIMDKAEVDTVTRSLVSKSPVAVTLENGHVTADELRADNNGERLIFKGRVKARFNY